MLTLRVPILAAALVAVAVTAAAQPAPMLRGNARLDMAPVVLASVEDQAIRDLVAAGYFDKCHAGELRGCSLFTRLVALRLNPTGQGGGWGWLSKSGAEEQWDGYSVDAMVWTNNAANLRNVVDIIGSAGARGATAGMGAFVERRPSNVWVKPVALSAADMAYLGGGDDGGGGGGGGGTPGGTDYAAQLARIEQQLAGIADLLMGRYGALLEQAASESFNAAVRALDIQQGIGRLESRPSTVGAWPEYSGSISLPGWAGGSRGITLRPVVP